LPGEIHEGAGGGEVAGLLRELDGVVWKVARGLDVFGDVDHGGPPSRGMMMDMAVIHISESDAVRDFAGLLARVRAGAEVVIEDGSLAVAVLHTPVPPRRSIAECMPCCRKTLRRLLMRTSPVMLRRRSPLIVSL